MVHQLGFIDDMVKSYTECIVGPAFLEEESTQNALACKICTQILEIRPYFQAHGTEGVYHDAVHQNCSSCTAVFSIAESTVFQCRNL